MPAALPALATALAAPPAVETIEQRRRHGSGVGKARHGAVGSIMHGNVSCSKARTWRPSLKAGRRSQALCCTTRGIRGDSWGSWLPGGSHRVVVVQANGRQQLGLEQEAEQRALDGLHAVHSVKLALLQGEGEAGAESASRKTQCASPVCYGRVLQLHSATVLPAARQHSVHASGQVQRYAPTVPSARRRPKQPRASHC